MMNAIALTRSERTELEQRAGTGRAEDARRARVILLLAEGHTWDETCERLECSRGFVDQWNRRFSEQRIAGLHSRHIGQVATVLNAQVEARISGGDSTRACRWSDALEHPQARCSSEHQSYDGRAGVAKARIEAASIERYMASNNPNFETKAADVIGLYLNPPAHATVFCVDEKPQFKPWIAKIPCCPDAPRGTA